MIWVGTGDEDDDSDDVASSYNQPTNTVATSTHGTVVECDIFTL